MNVQINTNYAYEKITCNFFKRTYKYISDCAKTAKDFAKHFYDIVSSSFAVILVKKIRQRYHLQRGNGVPSKVEGNEIIATQPVLFKGKSTKIRFFMF